MEPENRIPYTDKSRERQGFQLEELVQNVIESDSSR